MIDKAWLWFIVVIWIIGMILGTSMDKVVVGNPLGGDADTQTTFTYLTDVKNIVYKSNTAGQATFVLFNQDYFQKWGQALSWDYSFLPEDNDYAMMFKYIVLYPITLVTMAMFAALFTWMLSQIFGH